MKILKIIVTWLKKDAKWFVILMILGLCVTIYSASCHNKNVNVSTKYVIISIDGCEYIEWKDSNIGKNLLHKANCGNHREIEYVFKDL